MCRPSLFSGVAMAPPIEVFQLTRDFQVKFALDFSVDLLTASWRNLKLPVLGYFSHLDKWQMNNDVHIEPQIKML